MDPEITKRTKRYHSPRYGPPCRKVARPNPATNGGAAKRNETSLRLSDRHHRCLCRRAATQCRSGHHGEAPRNGGAQSRLCTEAFASVVSRMYDNHIVSGIDESFTQRSTTFVIRHAKFE